MMPDVDCGLCHASAIHISFAASLFVSRRSWNPTSTRSIAATKNTNLSRHSSHSGNVFTILHVNDRFFIVSRNTLYPSSSFPPWCQSFIVQQFFAASPVMSRSNAPRTIEIHAQLGTQTCFLRYIYIYTQRFSIFSRATIGLLKFCWRNIFVRLFDEKKVIMILKIIYIIFRNVH